jgi:hypothetical protein
MLCPYLDRPKEDGVKILSPTATPPAFRSISRGDFARLSGPAVRSFRAIADEWGLSEKDRISVLGMPGRSTYHQWMKKAEEHAPLSLPFDTLMRISGILGIYKALATIFHERTQAATWLEGAHRGTVFAGATPMSFVIEGGQDGIMTVRRYLDGWRGATVGHGAPEGSFEPVKEDDLVFI